MCKMPLNSSLAPEMQGLGETVVIKTLLGCATLQLPLLPLNNQLLLAVVWALRGAAPVESFPRLDLVSSASPLGI